MGRPPKITPPPAPPHPVADTRRRLTDAERTKIVELKKEGLNNQDIATQIRTSAGTVGNVLRNAGMGRGKIVEQPPAELSELQMRLIRYATRHVMGRPIPDEELSELRQILEEKFEQSFR
jgi:IS30 family transposase